MFKDISAPVISQAQRIAKDDADVAQSIIVMAYEAYQNAQKKGKELSVGELVNFMKYRASDLKNGVRLHVGSTSQIRKDVYNPKNYLSGEVEIHSLESPNENEDEPDYSESILTAKQDCSNDVIHTEEMCVRFLNQVEALDELI